MEENGIDKENSLRLFTSFNFADLTDKDEALKMSMRYTEIEIEDNAADIDVTLRLHELDLTDELWSPFPSDANTQYYMAYDSLIAEDSEGNADDDESEESGDEQISTTTTNAGVGVDSEGPPSGRRLQE